MLAVALLLASLQVSLDDASPTPDQEALHWLGVVFTFHNLFIVVFIGLLWAGLKEWREWHSLDAFAPAAAWVVLFYGVKEWGSHLEGELLSWPLKVAGVLALIIIPRLIILDRRRAEHREQVKTMPEPQNISGAAKETDFKDWA